MACVVFPATASAVGAARGWVHQQLEELAVDEEVCQRAELLVSEITTNVVRHTSSPLFELHLLVELDRLAGPILEISVHDQDPNGWPRSLHPTPDDICGRGLEIVEGLSHSWGTHRTASGKAVWFRLDPTRNRDR